MTSNVPVPLLPRPSWIRAKAPQGPVYERLRGLMRGLELHTVCEEAHCPNLGECWSRGTATFMILGEVCTRACGFCAVKTGLPGQPPDPDEPRRVADAVLRMGLRHAVVTSVNRDDQPDGGAGIFAARPLSIASTMWRGPSRRRMKQSTRATFAPRISTKTSSVSITRTRREAVAGSDLAGCMAAKAT